MTSCCAGPGFFSTARFDNGCGEWSCTVPRHADETTALALLSDVATRVSDLSQLKKGSIIPLHAILCSNWNSLRENMRYLLARRPQYALQAAGIRVNRFNLAAASLFIGGTGQLSDTALNKMKAFISEAGKLDWNAFVKWSKGKDLFRLLHKRGEMHFQTLSRTRPGITRAFRFLKKWQRAGKWASHVAAGLAAVQTAQAMRRGETGRAVQGFSSIAGTVLWTAAKRGVTKIGPGPIGLALLAGEAAKFGVETYTDYIKERGLKEDAVGAFAGVTNILRRYEQLYDMNLLPDSQGSP